MTIDEKIFFTYEGKTWEAVLYGDFDHPEMVECRNMRQTDRGFQASDDIHDFLRLPDFYMMQAEATRLFKSAYAALQKMKEQERRIDEALERNDGEK